MCYTNPNREKDKWIKEKEDYENSISHHGCGNGVSFRWWNQAVRTGWPEWRDYYGKEAFVKIHEFLINNYTPERSKELCMAGFILGNTLSDNGTVTRGICAVDENDYLTDVMETYEIKKTEDGAESQGNKINVNSHVSMNMWGLTPEFVGLLEEGFVEFFENIKGDEAKELKGEYLLPIYIDELLKKGKVSVKLLETQDKWFGVTYKEDKPVVVESFAKLIADGVYRKDLFSDLQA